MSSQGPSHCFTFFWIVLLCGLGAYFLISYRIYNSYPDVSNSTKCKNIQRWCKDEKTAKECGVLAYCRLQWSGHNIEEKGSALGPANKVSLRDVNAVHVNVYFEALCPDSEAFIINQLYPTFQKLYSTNIMNLVMVPYGKASQTEKAGEWIFSCQHGPEECLGNIIETCAIHIMGHVTKYMPFIYCMEKNGANVKTAKKCLAGQGMKYDAIGKCIKGAEGNYLEHKMGQKTEKLNPPATFIPWITINGKHSQEIENLALSNLHQLICNTYKGLKPISCKIVT